MYGGLGGECRVGTRVIPRRWYTFLFPLPSVLYVVTVVRNFPLTPKRLTSSLLDLSVDFNSLVVHVSKPSHLSHKVPCLHLVTDLFLSEIYHLKSVNKLLIYNWFVSRPVTPFYRSPNPSGNSQFSISTYTPLGLLQINHGPLLITSLLNSFLHWTKTFILSTQVSRHRSTPTTPLIKPFN